MECYKADARITELEAQLIAANEMIADLRDFAYNRAPTMAAEAADMQTEELRKELAEANAVKIKAFDAKRIAEDEHLKVCAELDEANARAEAAEKVARAAVAWKTYYGDDEDRQIETWLAFLNALAEYRAAPAQPSRPPHTHYCQHCAGRWECEEADCQRGAVSGCTSALAEPTPITPTPAMLDAKKFVDEYDAGRRED
jgi:hypothetical protein